MTSFFAGVKNWLFGDGSQKQQQPDDNQYTQHAGQKRDRRQQRLHEPVLQEVRMHAGGIQGFNWFTSSLKVDADGDAAHGFLGEQHGDATATTAAAAAAAAPDSWAGSCRGPTHDGTKDSSSSLQGPPGTQAGKQQQQQQQQRFKLHGTRHGNLIISSS